ncbi:hypothetical protein ACFO0N_09595 [Halobium salinum]|uniref:Uncharacterized protein n=1 Tax=Halobium salinum TaxID=1364940 RepID=A0ABD5PBB5_9EURY|nr:hypothetical protein [Halobium salinum]
MEQSNASGDVRGALSELRAGTTGVTVDGEGPYNVRERRERANYHGEYVDTVVDLIGERSRLRILANDRGERGSGEPTAFEVDPEGNRVSEARTVGAITLHATITSDVTVRDYVESLR